MGSLLGFRGPRFSEEEAWLPTWLQQHHVETFDDHIEEAQTTTQQRFMQNISTGKDVNTSRDEGEYKSCHLFLSGEDNSHGSLAPSSGNVVHFHLHLSLDGTSQNIPSSLFDTSQAGRTTSNNIQSVQQTEVSAGQKQMKNQFRMDYNVGTVNFPPLPLQQETSNRISPQSLAKDKDSDINEAVELSIAASEALVIHDIVKSSSSTKLLAAASVLEAALQVRQARLKGLEDSFHCPAEDIDYIDYLSDLDESSMADAFEDVGLSVSCATNLLACASATSEVDATPTSENHYGCNNKGKYQGNGAPEVDCDDISIKQHAKDILSTGKQDGENLSIEVVDCEKQRKLIDSPTFGLNTSIVASHNDSVLHCSVLANSDVPPTMEGFDFSVENISFQPQPNVNCSPQNGERDDKLTIIGPERFQSRWLGGWTLKKEIHAPVLVEPNNVKIIPKLLVGETSFLSESADIAPDENSFVKKQDKGFHVASQSSVLFEGLHKQVDEEDILFSQDFVRSSSLSLVDPLCSVVPCSISSENTCSTLAQNPSDEIDAGKCFGSASKDCNVNLLGNSYLNAEFGHKECQAVSTNNGQGSQSIVRRQSTSLRTYSTLLPSCSAFAGKHSINCHRPFPSGSSGLISADQSVGCKKCSTGLPYLVVQNPVSVLMTEQRNYLATASDGTELQVHMEKDRCLPLILNRGKRCRFLASKDVIHDVNGEENRKQSVMPRSGVELPKSKNLQKVQFKRKIDHVNEVPARKRVRFSETEIQLPHKKYLQKLQSSHRDCSTTRTGKRFRQSKPKSNAQQFKSHRRNCLDKDVQSIFQNIEFLLTGFSSQKEKEIESLIRKHGGIVLFDIPSPNLRRMRSSRLKLQQLPIVLCCEKLETTKFLYGCAVNAYILKIDWLTDSLVAGSALPPNKYMIMSNRAGEKCTRIGRSLYYNNRNYIFDGLGVMLHGKHRFCTKLVKVIKHGGAQVFKTLQRLVQNLDAKKISSGAIVAEEGSRASRHLKHCASEKKIPMMPAKWIITSLHAGKLLPFMEDKHSFSLPTIKILDFPASPAFSEEI